jgi:hypothetical protein
MADQFLQAFYVRELFCLREDIKAQLLNFYADDFWEFLEVFQLTISKRDKKDMAISIC